MSWGRSHCCRVNHPRPICCPCARRVCRNEVVNPVLTENFGFFNNTAVGTIASNAIIPLTTVQTSGSGVVSNNAGGIILAAGTYQVSYFANGTVPVGENISIALRVNGAELSGSKVTVTGTAGNVASLTQTIVIPLAQSGTLELVNSSLENVTYSLASMLIRRI